MSVVDINVPSVSAEVGIELERRVAARGNEVGTEENSQDWLAHRHHAKAEPGTRPTPISTMATTMAFEIVDLEAISADELGPTRYS